jgi:hypothetical protein
MGRIAMRYLGEKRSAQYLTQSGDGLIVIRMMPGVLRTWDFADDAELFGGSAE